MKNNQSGILFIELLMYILVVALFAAVAVPRVIYTTQRFATKDEMNKIVGMIQLSEIENEVLPANLAALKPMYFSDDTYKKDAWHNNYTYNKVLRQLCSTNVDVGCKGF